MFTETNKAIFLSLIQALIKDKKIDLDITKIIIIPTTLCTLKNMYRVGTK